MAVIRSWFAWRWIAVGSTGLLAGGLLGMRSGPHESVDTPPSRTISKSRGAHFADKSGKKDFATLVRRMELTGGIPEAGYAALGKANTTDLQRLFCHLAEPGKVREDWFGIRARTKAMRAIANELYAREGVESLNWAESTGVPMITQLLLCELGARDPVMLKSRLMENYEEFGIPGNVLMETAYAAAALRGTDDLLAVESLFEYDGHGPTGFADGFDFKSYLEHTKSGSGAEAAYRCLAATDPDGAAEMLRVEAGKLDRFSPEVFGYAFEARRGVVEEREAAKWISGLIGSLQGNARERALWELLARSNFRKDGTNLVPLVEELPEDADRLVVTEVLVNRGQLSMPVLTALKREDLQMQVLAKWLEKIPAPRREERSLELENAMDGLHLPQARRDELRAIIGRGL